MLKFCLNGKIKMPRAIIKIARGFNFKINNFLRVLRNSSSGERTRGKPRAP